MNQHLKDRFGKIDWTLEVEEGWVLHNIFFAHFLKDDKVVIHMYDLVLEFTDNNYSLCQGPVWPRGSHYTKAMSPCLPRHMHCGVFLEVIGVSKVPITTELQVL